MRKERNGRGQARGRGKKRRNKKKKCERRYGDKKEKTEIIERGEREENAKERQGEM